MAICQILTSTIHEEHNTTIVTTGIAFDGTLPVLGEVLHVTCNCNVHLAFDPGCHIVGNLRAKALDYENDIAGTLPGNKGGEMNR